MWKSESFKAAKVSETSADQLSKYQPHMLDCLGENQGLDTTNPIIYTQ